ncbi:MAG: glycogen/starch/alpha-glucan phosphorylase [Polyangiaceae bacterium]|nr:glycogen/starch/alpha-glucan phosphorylase [Polyangiaceae bacterium]
MLAVPNVSPKPPEILPFDGSDTSDFQRSVLNHVVFTCGKDVKDATPRDFYRAMAHSVRDRLIGRWLATQRAYDVGDHKQVHYFSSEFLTGRSLGLCLLNLGLYDAAESFARERGLDLNAVLEAEGDPGLGNGGLGRLAACFMDSLATLQMPAVGYGIRYDFGIFEQHIVGGEQVEKRDGWLEMENPWELARHEDAQLVRFYGRTQRHTDENGETRVEWVDARQVIGIPFDSFITGHKTQTVNTLRLWAARATQEFNLNLFNSGDHWRAVEEKVDSENISKVLYPADQTEHGRELRLKQQYFFVACSVADIVKRYKRRHKTFKHFPDRVAVQMNDTHPAITVAELMRVLVDEERLPWAQAWEITVKTLGYTNHTLMPEALETWPVAVFERLLPRHLELIYEINHRFLREVQTRWPHDAARLGELSIVDEGGGRRIRMAHLATVGSHSINGVARLHSDLIKTSLFPGFHELWPERFNNKTNGITPRRWLLYANPGLSQLITELIGSTWCDKDLMELERLREFQGDAHVLQRLSAIKQENKRELAQLIKKTQGISLREDAMYVVQVKRIHEYKRQLMNCLEIIDLYLRAKEDLSVLNVPRVYIFAGKAAPAYFVAKHHIKLICDVADVINSDPSLQGRLKVVFIPNYGVSLAQRIIPAADVSIQISLAGKEASGTSNMKFALNGALTVGTLDGANVEIREEVGVENFFLFGMTADEVSDASARGYSPSVCIARSDRLRAVVEFLESGFFSFGDAERFKSITEYLRHHDPFMVCADFDAYLEAQRAVGELFAKPLAFSKKALLNIAGAGKFSSDATIQNYVDDIWKLKPVPIPAASAGASILPGR